MLSVVELSSRYPQEGGLYVWSKVAFGEFSGFMAAWTYWTSNLPYFPAILYFAASNALFIRSGAWGHLSNNATFYIAFSLIALAVVTWLNVIGLDVGKWLHNLGALAMWIPVMIVIGMGMIAWHRFGSATAFTPHTLIPKTHLNDIIFWSVLTFAFGGCETASFMGEEIKNARRTIPFALLVAGLTVTFCYIVGTVSVMLALPASEVSDLQGLMQAITKTDRLCGMLWDEVQENPRYRGKTTVLILPELGRDGDVNTANGFLNHRSGDTSCRNVWLLALGAGVPKGETERTVQHVDIATTAAELLGAKCDGAGRALKELSL